MNINLSKFQKVDCDGKCTTLRHPSGHDLKISHKGISSELRKQLDELPMNMAKGGPVDPNKKPPSKPSKPSNSSNTMPDSPTEAKHAYTEPQDGGTDIVVEALNRQAPPFGPMGAEKHHSPPCINPSCKSYGMPHPNCRCYGGKMGTHGGYAQGGEVRNFCDDNRAHFKDCEYYAEGTPDEPVQAPEQAPAEPVAQEPDVNAAPIPAPQYGEPPPTPQTQAEPTPVDTAQNTAATLSKESLALQNDLNNGHIKPETYKDLFAKKDTLGKIGTIFGMLVGGAGAGLAHQPDILMGMMDNEINRDLDAQKTSAANRQNFLKIAQQGLANQAAVTGQNISNESAARALSWSAASRAALHNFTDMAMKLPPGKARNDAMMALTVLSQGIDKKEADMFSQVGLATAISEAAGKGGGNTQFLKTGLAGQPLARLGEDIEEKTLNGVPSVAGQQAARPIPQNYRDQAQAMEVLHNKGEDLLNYIKENKGTLNPKKRAVALQKIEEMKNFYNSSIQGGALTQGRLGWYDEQFAKHPTDILPQLLGSTEKLKEMVNSNKMREETLLNTLGFKPKKGAATQSAAPSNIPPGHKMSGGVLYKKGPNGEAIKVK